MTSDDERKDYMTLERAHSLWRVYPERGLLYWREKLGSSIKPDIPAGSLNVDGYVRIQHRGKIYMVHRLIWLVAHGKWPEHQIDHINGDRSDNRLCNLRDVTARANQCNRIEHRERCKEPGVRYFSDCTNKPWLAHAHINGKSHAIGFFATKAEAATARKAFLDDIRHPRITGLGK